MADGRWDEDPTGQFDLRYWDGSQWTEHVARNDVHAVDHLPSTPARSFLERWRLLSAGIPPLRPDAKLGVAAVMSSLSAVAAIAYGVMVIPWEQPDSGWTFFGGFIVLLGLAWGAVGVQVLRGRRPPRFGVIGGNAVIAFLALRFLPESPLVAGSVLVWAVGVVGLAIAGRYRPAT